jgi:hypothetical protein
MSITYYQDEHGGYLGVTGESPKGFRGIIFVGRGPEPGGGPETVHEQAYAMDQLGRLDRVDPCDVPAEWMETIGYEEPVEPYEPEPEPEEVTVCDIRFPWEVPPQVPPRKGKPLIRDPVFQVAMLAGVIVGSLWCWWG